MWIDKTPLLHVVDTQTHFSSALFLQDSSTESVWFAFLECWATIYPGYPDKIRADQCSQFTFAKWENLMKTSGIQLPTISH